MRFVGKSKRSSYNITNSPKFRPQPALGLLEGPGGPDNGRDHQGLTLRLIGTVGAKKFQPWPDFDSLEAARGF